MENAVIKIGTRGSALALAQTELVIDKIKKLNPGINIKKVIISTKGDKEINRPVSSFGGKGAFVTEIEDWLFNRKIDMAVHSAKDLPDNLRDGLVVSSVLEREDARDVLVTVNPVTIENLFKKEHSVIGTGSLRRRFQLKLLYKNAEFKDIRGNVPTRIDKLYNGEYDGIVLAAAGLKRLGLDREAGLSCRYFSYDEMVPAGGQGIIAVETREEDSAGSNSYLGRILKDITDMQTLENYYNERKILEGLNAGCHEALGVISFNDYKNGFTKIKFIKDCGNLVHKYEVCGRNCGRKSLTDEIIKSVPL